MPAISVQVIFLFGNRRHSVYSCMMKLEIKIQDLTEFSLKIAECSPGPGVRKVVRTEQKKFGCRWECFVFWGHYGFFESTCTCFLCCYVVFYVDWPANLF